MEVEEERNAGIERGEMEKEIRERTRKRWRKSGREMKRDREREKYPGLLCRKRQRK